MIVLQVLFQKQPYPQIIKFEETFWLQEPMTITKIEEMKSDKTQWHSHQVRAKFVQVWNLWGSHLTFSLFLIWWLVSAYMWIFITVTLMIGEELRD